MKQEDLNEIMWNSLPEWRKQQLYRERERMYVETPENKSAAPTETIGRGSSPKRYTPKETR